jgi:outer membrane protein assembly factor BamB/tetratricopeptide (TPR) repeat protein
MSLATRGYRWWLRISLPLLAIAAAFPLAAQEPGTFVPPSAATVTNVIPDPFAPLYRDYAVDFSAGLAPMQQANRPVEEMKLSSEASFFTLSLLEESSRADALVEAAREKENSGMFKEALEIYQKVIDDYPDVLHRVSQYGIFVPITEYSQLRILAFPKEHLDFYRTKHDSRAREAYEMSRQRNSLEGLAQIRDSVLATSYGAPALITLGYSALDQGHYLEALEYFDKVWKYYPEVRAQQPHLPMSMALCRKMLGLTGAGSGLVGHWKLDETTGNKAMDATGFANHGTFIDPQAWIPGKVGGAMHFTQLPEYRSNCINVPAATPLNIGVGGADFSVAFWLSWESGAYPNTVFCKKGRNASEMLNFEVTRGNQVLYTIATENPTWETGASRQALTNKVWTHVGLVKIGTTIKLFLNGRLDRVDTLKGQPLPNCGGVTFGHGMQGAMDDVRLYGRALLDREVAELAGTVGSIAITATPASGETPLAVEFSCGAPQEKAEYLWEFGDGESEPGPKAKHAYGVGGDYTALLSVTDARGNVSVGRAKIAVKWNPKSEEFAKRMNLVMAASKPNLSVLPGQRASDPHVAVDDYIPFPPPNDPLGHQLPVWKQVMPGSRRDTYVNTQPVITKNSVLFRHKNILYCHSILNGELRWKNDLGGRVVWQDENEFQWPQEDILVQDGMVFAPMLKVGQTLMAVDEITGRLKWAYGPMVASTPEEANLRFGAAPAGGPQTVFAGYVQDNIEGDTHVDTEYGVIAFESATGRIKWRRAIGSMRPGLFSAGFAVRRRNKIRSFFSPPLYHEGTVYTCTDAGTVAALDALSGRIKWVMRYPYYRRAHDATLSVYENYYHPVPWLNQRPLLIGDQLYVVPVDSTLLLCLDRRTGKVIWNRSRPPWGREYFAGAISTGEIVLTTWGRCRGGYDLPNATPLSLLDPRTGKTTWEAPDLIAEEKKPCLAGWRYNTPAEVRLNERPFDTAARPFLTADDVIYIPSWSGEIGPWWRPGCHIYHLAVVDLKNRAVTARRRYLTDTLLAHNAWQIAESANVVKNLEQIPFKDERTKDDLRVLKEVMADTVPANDCAPFLPFSRATFDRYGTQFELRTSARALEMVYDREKVKQALAGRTDPEGLFARAELAMADNRLKDAAALMVQCLGVISSEDQDFRATVNQLLYKVHKELARAAIRSGDKRAEQENCVGMSRTVTTLADEVETIFAVAQAAERRGDFANAARQLQSIANIYGQYEYPVPEIAALDGATLGRELNRVLDHARDRAGNPMFGTGLQRGVDLLRTTYPVYNSAVSPLPKTLAIRAGEIAAQGMMQLQKQSPDFTKEFEKLAKAAIGTKSAEEQIARLWEFPGTPTAQSVIEKLLAESSQALQAPAASIADQAECRKRMWLLSDTARICGLTVPEAFRARLHAPPPEPPAPPLPGAFATRSNNFEEARGTAWLVVERRGDRTIEPDLVFLAGRVKKKLDNKFVLTCLNSATGEIVWKAQEKRGETWFDEIRLQGKGDERGFFEAFVHGDIVVVHGMFDVLAFDLKDGKLRWRYEVPFAFDIKCAIKNGDLLVLAGQSETITLYLPTRDPRGEVVWQEKEEGDIYIEPYFVGDRLVTLRKAPANLTVRYRSTGKMMGRLYLPDLLQEETHPLIERGLRELPAAHDGRLLAVSDGWYYIMLDVEKLAVVWKRLIDNNDTTKLPPMRFALKGDYFAVLKQDFDAKAAYMLASTTGEVLWHTDPKDPNSPQPFYSAVISGDKLYALRPHPGQAFYFVGVDCKTGKNLYPANEQKGYGGKPEVTLRPDLQGDGAVAFIKDRQDFEVKAFDLKDGKLLQTLRAKATGDFGEHGRVSATVQNGRLLLFGKNDLHLAGKK